MQDIIIPKNISFYQDKDSNRISNLKNRRFDKLLVEEYHGHGVADKNSYWLCLCDCGIRRIVKGSCLMEGKTHNCGNNNCVDKAMIFGKNNHKWKGCGEISGNYFGNIKYKAHIRKKEFNITIEYVWDLFLKQNRKCALSGQELVFADSIKTKNKTTASLDRINSSLGYVEGNVQWIHKDINKMKMDYDEKQFIELCRKIVSYENGSQDR